MAAVFRVRCLSSLQNMSRQREQATGNSNRIVGFCVLSGKDGPLEKKYLGALGVFVFSALFFGKEGGETCVKGGSVGGVVPLLVCLQ